MLSVSCRHAARIVAPRANATQSGWVDLRPLMELRIQNAYYRDGLPKQGVDGYLGTETAHFQVRERGVRLLSVENLLKPHPREEPPVQELIPPSHRGFAHYRYFYAVVFNHRGNIRGSVLLGAASTDELDGMGAALVTDPDTICSGSSGHCVVFPEMCTVSIDIEIVVNGVPRVVASNSLLASVATGAHHVELSRRKDAGLAVPPKIDPADPRSLPVPLMPGDRINWN